MENVAEKTTPPPPGSTEQPKGSLWRLQGIFFQPTETFRAIAKKPTWLIATILCVVIGIVGFMTIMNQVGFENLVIRQAQARGQEVSDEQLEMMNSPAVRAVTLGTMLIGTPIVMLLTAGLLLALFWLIGSDVSFSRTFSVVAHSMMAFTVISTAISLVVVLLAADPTELDVQNLVASNPGVLVDSVESPVTFALLSSIDLFSFYYLFLLALGMSIVGRKSFGTSAGMVLMLWVAYVALKTAWTALVT
ncbi:MAG TPA: YIP1 family protein [Acidobacteriota bacterium]|nr:YIP1 family protein [Acidobacteriota bacterium]